MDRKDLECYAYGIHIGRLTKEDAEKVLQKYYHISYLPKLPFQSENNSTKRGERIKGIYDRVLYILLLNGYRLPLKEYDSDSESINPSLYFEDMVMLLYLYVVNQKKALSTDDLPTSSATKAFLFYIEQSGFGNILGLRRENKTENGGKDKNKSMMVQYVATFPDKGVDYVIEKAQEEEAANNSACSVKRNEKKRNYNIPYACKDVLVALLKSRKNNFFVFSAERDETLSNGEIRRMMVGTSLEKEFKKPENENLSEKEILPEEMYDEIRNIGTEYFNGLPISIFSKEIQKAIFTIAIAGGGAQRKLMQFYNQPAEDVSETKEFRFYNKYFDELEKSEKYWKEYKYDEEEWKKCWKRRGTCIKNANRYLSELLFAYLYYEQIFAWRREMINKKAIAEDEFSKFLLIIYEVSKSPACLSRMEHIRQYRKRFFSAFTSEEEISGEKPYKMREEFIENERYTVQKFLPAFFYCLLYYMKKEGVIKEEYNENSAMDFEGYIKDIKGMPERLDGRSFKKWLSGLEAKKIWKQRKIDFLKPVDYEMGKALF